MHNCRDVHCAQLIFSPWTIDVRRIRQHQCFENMCKMQVINDAEEMYYIN
jgi:hypothetical protein